MEQAGGEKDKRHFHPQNGHKKPAAAAQRLQPKKMSDAHWPWRSRTTFQFAPATNFAQEIDSFSTLLKR